jgi:hypothetical protein
MGMIIDGIGLIICGMWNIGITVMPIVLVGAAGIGRSAHIAVIGVMQISYAVQRFQSYSRYKGAIETVPATSEDLAALDRLASDIEKGKPEDRDDIVAFTMATFWSHKLTWRAQLIGSEAILLNRQAGEMFFLTKDEFDIEVTGKEFLSKRLKASFNLKHRKGQGSLTPESYAKYQAWKEEADTADVPEVEPAD